MAKLNVNELRNLIKETIKNMKLEANYLPKAKPKSDVPSSGFDEKFVAQELDGVLALIHRKSKTLQEMIFEFRTNVKKRLARVPGYETDVASEMLTADYEKLRGILQELENLAKKLP